MLKSNPDQLALLKQNNPRLAEALETSPEEFAKILREQQKARLERENARLRYYFTVASLEGGQGGQLTPLEFWKIP